MSDSWKVSGTASREIAEAALAALQDDWDFPADIAFSTREIADDRPDEWLIEAWLPRRPGERDKRAINRLFLQAPPRFNVERVEDQDWVTLSQEGLDPITAGRFHVHIPQHPPRHDLVNLVIPAGQAFGTGQHQTTAGCLAMLDRMKRQGLVVRNHIDVGTGTGLLAFAAIRLWPRALATASDIDPVCLDVMRENAGLNDISVGGREGEVLPVIADGTSHPLLTTRAPYDLLVANILAGPLIELAPDFERIAKPGGSVVLAGLLTKQEDAVRRAYFRHGFRLASRLVMGEWSILWLRKRR